MSDIVFLIIVALVGVGVGIAIGVLVSGSRTDKKGAAPADLKSAGNMVEIVRIMQDRKSGQPYPLVNGTIVRFPADLPASQRQRLSEIFRLLLGWISPSEAAKPEPAKPVEAAGEPITPPPTVQVPTATSQSLRISPVDVFARAIQPEVRVPPEPVKSIAAQIDEILQEKLAEAHLENQAIRLIELPAKGLVVMVGMKQYGGVDEVPDETIRGLIRLSVAEWEKRSAES